MKLSGIKWAEVRIKCADLRKDIEYLRWSYVLKIVDMQAIITNSKHQVMYLAKWRILPGDALLMRHQAKRCIFGADK